MNQLVRQLFEELAALTPAGRERVFADRSVAPGVRDEVESLLRFDAVQGVNFTACVADAAAEMLLTTNGSESGDFGPYRRVRLLGSGGMGTVYLAERRDGEIQQKVAVKLLGGNRPAWRERFLRERRLLASLNHPSIVHVIDAGHTQDGQPYLVMEYVEGVPIDIYAAGIAVHERLKLFLRVCEGVSHAHRHLIVHRDLKPSNILVDDSGRPKLLDFGIAKLLDETGEPTETVERLLTPNYASPEQLRGESQTTATDVYSLGAVLYKLLTGRSPHETGGEAAAFEVIVGARQVPPPTRLNPEVPADLDYILRKALRTEPEERYASVDAFADDIRALLEWRPVAARAGDVWYRTRRFLRRYWMPATAAAVTLAGLSTGLYIANHERAIAQRRFLEVRQLANKLFDIDAAVRRSPGTTRARQLIVDTSLEYLQRLAADARGDPELALEIGNAYMRVARVQGVPMQTSNLGQTEQAEQSLKAADAMIHSALALHSENRTAILRMAEITHDRMMLLGLRRPGDRALVLARQTTGWLDKYLDSGQVDPREGEEVILLLEHVANQYQSQDHLEEALRLCQRALELAPRLNQPLHAGNVLQITTMIHRDRGELGEALRDSRESARILGTALAASNPPQGMVMNYALSLVRQAEILGGDDAISMGRFQEAVAPLERAFELAESFARQDPQDSFSRIPLSMAGIRLGSVLRHSDPQRALAVFDHTLRRLGEIPSNSRFRRDEVKALAGSSYALRALGRPAEARRRLDSAFSRLRELKLYPAAQIQTGSEPEAALRALADYEEGAGNRARAIEIYANLLDGVLAAKPRLETSLTDALHVANIWAAKAALHRRSGQPELARALETWRRDLWLTWDRTHPNNAFVRRQLESAGSP
jgi:tetratricopeptide (TPR) repeat protein/predicted Ser/Thr protein kinase